MLRKPIILICDDHSLLRHGLSNLLRETATVRECDEVGFLRLLNKFPPDLVILDYVLEKTNGLELLREARRCGYGGRALMVSNVEEYLLRGKIEEAGFDGYVSKRANLDTILATVKGVLAGKKIFVEPGDESQPEKNGNPFGELTRRELDVLVALVRSKNYAEGAEKLGITVRTFQKHRENIGRKTGGLSNTELIKLAYIWNIVGDPGIITTYR